MGKRKMANKKLANVIKKCAERYPNIPFEQVRLIWLEGFSYQANENNVKSKTVFNKPSKDIIRDMKRLKGFYPFANNIQENPAYASEYFAAELQRVIMDSGCNWDQVVSIAKNQK